MVCASKGYPFVCVMSEAFSIERRKMMRFLGAKVILTNPAHKFGGMLQTLMALKAKHDWYWPNQFENGALAIQRKTPGPLPQLLHSSAAAGLTPARGVAAVYRYACEPPSNDSAPPLVSQRPTHGSTARQPVRS